ncbi:hypothetical protein COU75_04540 [Candidatus Peregrinibacteria bacterium CG10_big_fil_rev_8_21_14_0_10_42_8]|nr:MAG: hypothetical protein COU75_04540 [Candidatus Peregrinibacteria bacterium CG10_big_fil_rev_8_21_14_0_10_42_8]
MSNNASKNAERAVVTFTLLYLLIASLFSWRLQNWEFVFYVFVVLIIGLMVMNIHKRVQFSTGILWCLSGWGLMHMLGGLISIPETWSHDGDHLVLYSFWLIPDYLKYDHIIHGYGFGVGTWACWQALSPIVVGTKEYISEIIIAVLAANGLGALNEIIEFFATLVIPSTNVGGYVNTGWDLVSNLVGSMAAAFIIWFGKPIDIDLTKRS